MIYWRAGLVGFVGSTLLLMICSLPAEIGISAQVMILIPQRIAAGMEECLNFWKGIAA